MKVQKGDYVFTTYRGRAWDITPNKLYEVEAIKGPHLFTIVDDVGDEITTGQTEEHNSAHLNHEGVWYKCECSITNRHQRNLLRNPK